VALLFFYSLVSGRLERSVVTAPIVFTAAGMLTALALPELRGRSGGMEAFLRVAEIGLVLLLFTDASRTDLALLRGIRQIPVRLLTTGLLLTIALGALCALVVFRQLSIWEAGIVAAILAPTDAGLGQVIVSSPRVPALVRQGLNVEAGLNDGLSVPFLLFFIALAAPLAEGGHTRLGSFIAEQLGYGAAIGVAIGLAGGLLLARAQRAGWLAESFQHLGVDAAVRVRARVRGRRASMFIAAFVAARRRWGPKTRAGTARSWPRSGQLPNLCLPVRLLVARRSRSSTSRCTPCRA
jgi:NhaP-type Na+/H+ or K+/H+ antiporter